MLTLRFRLVLAVLCALMLHGAAAQENDVALALPPGTVLNTLTDTQANAVLATLGYTQPPFAGPVYEIRTTESLQLVRTYLYNPADPFNPSGRWTMRALNIRGLTPAQVRDFYALPTAVDRTTVVQVPAGTRLYAGLAGPIAGWGDGGGPQFYLFDRPAFGNYQPQTVLTADMLYYTPRSAEGNMRQVANYLDQRLPVAFSDTETVYSALDVLAFSNAAALQGALNQLSGEVHTALGAASVDAARSMQRALLDRMPGTTAMPGRTVLASLSGVVSDAAGGMGSSAGSDGMWTRLVGNWGRVGADEGAAGYAYRTRGLWVGRDLGNHLRGGGLAGGYAQTSVGFDRNGDSGTVQSLQLAAYGKAAFSRAYLRGVLGVSYDRYDAQRHLSFLGRNTSAGYDGYGAHGALELGWPGSLAGGHIEPYTQLGAVYMHRNGFTEEGAGAADLVAAAAAQRSLQLGAGVRFNRTVQTTAGTRYVPVIALMLSHEVLDRAAVADMRLSGLTGSFPVTGAAAGRDAVSMTAALGFQVRRNVAAYMGYRFEHRENAIARGATAGLAARW